MPTPVYSLKQGQFARTKNQIVYTANIGDNIIPAYSSVIRAGDLFEITRDNKLERVYSNQPAFDYFMNEDGALHIKCGNLTQYILNNDGVRNSNWISIEGTQDGTWTECVPDPFGGNRALRYVRDADADDDRVIRVTTATLPASIDYYCYIWVRLVDRLEGEVSLDLGDKMPRITSGIVTPEWRLFEFNLNESPNNWFDIQINQNNYPDTGTFTWEFFGPFVWDCDYFTPPVISSGSATTTVSTDTGASIFSNLGLDNMNPFTILIDVDFNPISLDNEIFLNIRNQNNDIVGTFRNFINNGDQCLTAYLNEETTYPFNTSVEANRTQNGKIIWRVGGNELSQFTYFNDTVTKQTYTLTIPFQLSRFEIHEKSKSSAGGAGFDVNFRNIEVYNSYLSDDECNQLIS